MPSGALPLLEASKYGDNLVKKGLVEKIMLINPIAEMMPWLPFEGEALKHREEDTLPRIAFRDVNETYSKTFGTDTEHFWGVAICGGEVFIDNFLLKVTANKLSAKSEQWAKFAKAIALQLQGWILDATGTAKDFKGINALVSEGWGYLYTPNANGGALTLDNLDVALDVLRKDPSAMLMHKYLRRKITILARTSVSGVSLIDVGNDMFGRKVTSYDGVPIRILQEDINGTQLLDFDETCGSSNVTSSIYIAHFGGDGVCGLLGAGGSFEVQDFGETEAAPGHLGRVEFFPGMGMFGGCVTGADVDSSWTGNVVRYNGLTKA